jgi:hypothetical protein
VGSSFSSLLPQKVKHTMKETRLNRRNAPVILALVLVGVFALFTVVMLAQFANQPSIGTPEPSSEDSYQARVDALLAIAQPANAEAVITKYACTACHQENGLVAPSWETLTQNAATRHPPLSAGAYIYESIAFPSAFVVEGYNDVMPKDFGARMTEQELADVLAYLLAPPQ